MHDPDCQNLTGSSFIPQNDKISVICQMDSMLMTCDMFITMYSCNKTKVDMSLQIMACT